MESVSFTVHGLPMPKGSLTRMPNGAMVPAGTRETRERVNAWRYDVQTAAAFAMDERPPFKGAIRLTVDASLPVPKTTIRKYQVGWWPHVRKPDVDKLLRSVMDHLTGIVWIDDAQVIWAIVSKSYAWQGNVGAFIEVSEYDDEALRYMANGRVQLLAMLDQT